MTRVCSLFSVAIFTYPRSNVEQLFFTSNLFNVDQWLSADTVERFDDLTGNAILRAWADEIGKDFSAYAPVYSSTHHLHVLYFFFTKYNISNAAAAACYLA